MKSRAGLTLAEVVLSVGILAVVFLSLLAVFIAGARLQARSADVTAATELARGFLERVKGPTCCLPAGTQVFDGRVPTSPLSGFPPPPYPQIEAHGKLYTLVVQTAPVPGTSNTISVSVEVSWDQTASLKLETYVIP